jgi:hypothetical protein
MVEQKQQPLLDAKLTAWEENQAKFAKHRAYIMQILKEYPEGLTVQKIISIEQAWYGYTFMTDNRLRELKAKDWVECFGENPQKWRAKKIEA